MKTSHYFFLILILSAAIISGTTLAILNNFTIIKEHLLTKDNIKSYQEAEKQTQDTEHFIKESRIENKIILNSNTVSSRDNLLLSLEEKQEISSMINDMNIEENSDFKKNINEFMEKNSDIICNQPMLSAIIHQATLQKTAENLSQ